MRTRYSDQPFAGSFFYQSMVVVGHVVMIESVAFNVYHTPMGWFWSPVDDPLLLCGPYPTAEGAYLNAIGE